MTRAWRKKNLTNRRRVALGTLEKIQKPNKQQLEQIETLKTRIGNYE